MDDKNLPIDGDKTTDSGLTQQDINNSDEKGQPAKSSKKGLIIQIVSWGIFVAVFLLFSYVLGCRLTGNIPKFFGRSFFVVVTDSMEPTINVGDTITVKDADISDVEVEQIILFKRLDSDMNIVHRVKNVEVQDGKIVLTTKGDNSLVADTDSVTEDNFLGVVVSTRDGWSAFAKIALNGYALVFVLILIILTFVVVKQIKNIKKELALQKEINLAEAREEILKELLDAEKSKEKQDDCTKD